MHGIVGKYNATISGSSDVHVRMTALLNSWHLPRTIILHSLMVTKSVTTFEMNLSRTFEVILVCSVLLLYKFTTTLGKISFE